MQNIAVKMARWDGKRHAGIRRAVLLCILCLLAVKHINKRKGDLLMERSLRIVKESASGRGKESLRRKFRNFCHLPFQGRHGRGAFQYVPQCRHGCGAGCHVLMTREHIRAPIDSLCVEHRCCFMAPLQRGLAHAYFMYAM